MVFAGKHRMELALLMVKYDILAKSQKKASILFTEFTIKSGCTAPVKSIFLNSPVLISTNSIIKDLQRQDICR
jgi:hypothetical protein